MIRAFIVAATLLASGAALADTLLTPSFRVEIKVNCAEGNVSCDDVLYTGTNLRTGESLILRGRTMHAVCVDGVTPCRFLGYEFRSANIRYTVLETGELVVTQGGKVMIREPGVWQH